MTSLRQISISLDPVEAIKMCSKPAHDLAIIRGIDSYFFLYFQLVVLCSILDEWPIEKVTIERGEDKWLCFPDMIEKLDEQLLLIWFIEHSELSNIILWFWTVFKVFHICSNDLPICD